MKKILAGKLKGVYTVEAAAIISLCLLFFGTGILISFEVFKECISDVQSEDNFDAVKLFRLREAALGVYEQIKGE